MKYYDKEGGLHKRFFGAKWKNFKIRSEELWQASIDATVDQVLCICNLDYNVITGDKTDPDYQTRATEALVNIIVTASDLSRGMPVDKRKAVFAKITDRLGIMEGNNGSI